MSEQLRFRAEWIEENVVRDGELQPDLARHGYSYHGTHEEAEKAAQEQADTFGVVDWWAVEEQRYDKHEHPPWVVERRWVEGCEIDA